MTSTEVYHYPFKSQTTRKEPKKFSIPNGIAFCDFVHKIFGVDLRKGTNHLAGNGVQRKYNEFIESDVPKWQKVVATFASAGTLIFDEDREEVGNALYRAEAQLELPYSQLSGLALLLEALPTGLVAVAGNSVSGCCLSYDKEGKNGYRTVWYSQKELKEMFLRAAVPTRWTYVDRN